MRFLLLFTLATSMCNGHVYADETKDENMPELIGGTVADPADWPASPWIGNCSSTIIGDRVLLTAAHCVGNGGSVRFSKGTTVYSGRCTHHSEYRGNSTADWALCELSSAVPDVMPETVAKPDQVTCESGKEFLWTGYGCTRWGSRLDGKFRTGTVDAIRCPSGRNYDTVTRGNVALCSGDSGGGGYVVDGDGKRMLVGVNSRSDTRVTSYVSSTYVGTFQDWARSWAENRGLDICGITKDCDPGDDDDDDDGDDDEPDCGDKFDAFDEALEDLRQCLGQ